MPRRRGVSAEPWKENRNVKRDKPYFRKIRPAWWHEQAHTSRSHNLSIGTPSPAVKLLLSFFSDLAFSGGSRVSSGSEIWSTDMLNPLHAAGRVPAWQRSSHTPARQVVAPSGGIVRGWFPSIKAQRMIAFESLLERAWSC